MHIVITKKGNHGADYAKIHWQDTYL